MRGDDLMHAWAAAGGDPHALSALRGLDLRGITADSRMVRPGMIFAALPGTREDGARYIADALARGAAAVLTQSAPCGPSGMAPCPIVTDPEPRRALALIAAILAGRQPAHVVAVTGTNGKTSVAEFLRQFWALSGRAAASIGTLGLTAPGFEHGPGLTTPDPVAVAQILADVARAGIDHAAIEASSHGLHQFRLDGVRLCAGGFTNLTRDHLDYHLTMDAYRTAKLRLFDTLLPEGAPAIASATLDSESLDALRAVAARRRLALQVVGPDSVAARPDGQDILYRGWRLHLPLAGRFQADNALVAAALAEASGVVDPWSLLGGLVGVRGRLELVARLDDGAAAYVDYAHTPDALTRVIAALRPHTEGRLHLVFGAGGDRDPGKRPLMGAAAQAADVVIVTDDNPRSEDPASIRAAVRARCPGAREIGDRAEAIAAGLAGLAAGDVLIVAGKGHEQGQIVGDHILPFDDADVIRRLVEAA